MFSPKHTAIERFCWIVVAALTVFFARWQFAGLQPDAALYAGFSLKVLNTGQNWLIEGSKFFQKFHEHPPFFFIWGAEVLKHLGTSDGAARAIGGIFGALSFIGLGLWLWRRFGWSLCALTLFFVATTGHYTKFAATSMLEAPLSLAVMLVWIASYELYWQKHSGLKRPFWILVVYVGLMLATASKGLGGLGAWGGLCLSLALAFFFSIRSPRRIFVSFFTLSFALLIALVPMAFWLFRTFKVEGPDALLDYFFNQVVRSALTNRGENLLHPPEGDHYYYFKVLLHSGWPWWWTFVLAWVALFLRPYFIYAPIKKRLPRLSELGEHPFRGLVLSSLAFVIAFVLPFSLVKFQLPHYLHPIYLVSLPIGAFLVLHVLPERVFKILENILSDWRPRWALVAVAALFLMSVNTQADDANRGQAFARIAPILLRVEQQCVVLVPKDAIDAYRMEAYSMWYWRARKWDYATRDYVSKLAVPNGMVFWNPANGDILGRGPCDPG